MCVCPFQSVTVKEKQSTSWSLVKDSSIFDRERIGGAFI